MLDCVLYSLKVSCKSDQTVTNRHGLKILIQFGIG